MKKIRIIAELNLDTNEVRFKRIEDPWSDLGYAMEVLGFLIYNASKYTEKSLEDTIKHSQEYIARAARDYKHKLNNGNN